MGGAMVMVGRWAGLEGGRAARQVGGTEERVYGGGWVSGEGRMVGG